MAENLWQKEFEEWAAECKAKYVPDMSDDRWRNLSLLLESAFAHGYQAGGRAMAGELIEEMEDLARSSEN